MRAIYHLPFHHIFIVGGRGIGKTYTALEMTIEDNIKFMLLRRLQTQSDIISKPEMSPFKVLNNDKGWSINPGKISKYTYGFYDSHVEEGKLVLDKDVMYGYGASLSTFANIRGFDGSDIDIILYDEFIPQISERHMSYEADSFFNMIETVNRNREVNGIGEIKVICLANASDLANPIFIELGIVNQLMKIKAKNEFYYENPERDLCVIMPKDSPISEAKKNTALYKLASGTQFFNNAINNEFVFNRATSIASRNLKEYKPIVSIGEVTIFQHKGNSRIYVSTRKNGAPEEYGCSAKEIRIFQRRFPGLRNFVFSRTIDYESYSCEVLFDKYTDLSYN